AGRHADDAALDHAVLLPGPPSAVALRFGGDDRARSFPGAARERRHDRGAGDQAMNTTPATKRIAAFSSMLFLAGCATSHVEPDITERAQAVFVAAFADGDAQILVRVEHQDEAQGLCSKHRNEPPRGVAELIERTQRAAMRYPSSGRLMGDWHRGK